MPDRPTCDFQKKTDEEESRKKVGIGGKYIFVGVVCFLRVRSSTLFHSTSIDFVQYWKYSLTTDMKAVPSSSTTSIPSDSFQLSPTVQSDRSNFNP